MRFYSKGIKDSKDFTTNGKIKSLILGLKDIDKVDNLAIKLSMISRILQFYYVNNKFSDKCLMSRTSRILDTNNENRFMLFRNRNVFGCLAILPPKSSPALRYCILVSKERRQECLV